MCPCRPEPAEVTIFKTKNNTTKFKIRTSRVSLLADDGPVDVADAVRPHHQRFACQIDHAMPISLTVTEFAAQYLYTLTLPNKKAAMVLDIVPPGLREIKGKGVKKTA